jgi:hypothetical protein
MRWRRTWVLGVVALTEASCSPTAPRAASPEPTATAPQASPTPAARETEAFTAPSPPPAPSSPPPPPIASWTDPGAVAMLVEDCAAKAPLDSSGSPNPLLCSQGFEQSCAYDPCFDRLAACHARCSKTCDSCESRCVGSCSSCKANCKDAPCKEACAEKTGACRQACLAPLDHCSTAECARTVKTCPKDEYVKWTSNGCSCDCADKCLSDARGDPGPCLKSCRTRQPKCDIGYCITSRPPTDPDAPGNP